MLTTAMDGTGYLPINAFSSLFVHNLVSKGGEKMAVSLSKGDVITPKLRSVSDKDLWFRHTRPLSTLPPPADLCLGISVTELIGEGRAGNVFKVDTLSASYKLPSIVAKVSKPGHAHRLAREAWFYDEMESLQGVAIARCYGFFQVKLDEESEFIQHYVREPTFDKYDDYIDHFREPGELPFISKPRVLKWPPDSERSKKINPAALNDRPWAPVSIEVADRGSISPSSSNSKGAPDSSGEKTEGLSESCDKKNTGGRPLSWTEICALAPWCQKAEGSSNSSEQESTVFMPSEGTEPNHEFESDPQVLSILILEQLGNFIPLRTQLDGIRTDLHEVYHDIAQLGVVHEDVRWRNILRVPKTSKWLPCPTHGHVHRWCAVDFDTATRTQFTTDHLDETLQRQLRRLLNGLQEGTVVEPWE